MALEEAELLVVLTVREDRGGSTVPGLVHIHDGTNVISIRIGRPIKTLVIWLSSKIEKSQQLDWSVDRYGD